MILSLRPIGFYMVEFADEFGFWRPQAQYFDVFVAWSDFTLWEYCKGICCRITWHQYAKFEPIGSDTKSALMLCAEEAREIRRLEYARQRSEWLAS